MATSKSKLTARAKTQRPRERRRGDAAFAHMADDTEYRNTSLQISEEFARSDWEAPKAGEREIAFPHTK